MEKAKRIQWVDIGKYICIMFVMLSHLESRTEILKVFYTPFFLTAFFFLSGYVYRSPGSFRTHMVKKVKGLFVPWLIFSNLNILLSMLITLKHDRNYMMEFALNLLQIRGHGDGVWFVAALFVAFIPFYFVIEWDKPVKAVVTSFVLSLVSVMYMRFAGDFFPWGDAALPWHFEYIFQAMFWMVLGYYFKQYAESTFDSWNTSVFRIVIWTVYFILMFLPDIIGWRGSILLSYVRSIFGIFAIISVCKVLPSNCYIKFVGENTLIYFALHGKVYAVIETLLARFNFYTVCLENQFSSSVLAVGITVIMSVILIIPAVIINKWFPWILGRKKERC